jgi:DNA repair exonuclease SbcCD ATPase subunit
MALASRKYSRDEKIKKDEEELEQLIAENKGEVKEEAQEQEPEPTSAEEKTFKKRYGDLRRHSQQKEADLQEQINQLKEQLDSATKKQIELPKSDEDIEAWTKKYPDVAGIVETIAIKKSKEQAKELEDRIQKINEMQESATKEKAEVELLTFITGLKSNQSGCRKLYMKMMMMQCLQPELLIYTKLIEILVRRRQAQRMQH